MAPSGSSTSVPASGAATGAESFTDAGAKDATGDEAEAFEVSLDGGADSSDALAESSAAVADSSDVLSAPDLLPVAPSASRFAWQSLQTDFLLNGTPCTGRVAMSVSDHAVCYENSSDELVCAGFTYMTQYGSTFVPTGQTGVDQVILSATFNSDTGNAVCVHNTSNHVLCFGDGNSWGQFGNGDPSPAATWVQWGGASATFARIATGTWDQMCALDLAGSVYCSGLYFGTMTMMPMGLTFGTSPELQPSSGPATAVWVDPSGMANIDDSATFRASDGRASCTITVAGLACSEVNGATFGRAGAVVSGGPTGGSNGDVDEACWNESDGRAWCAIDPSAGNQFIAPAATPVFAAAGTILYVSTNYYTSNVCAVAADGSLWCFGPNSNGELGTGNTDEVTVATQVQPPGSVFTACR
jgi:hypothetical protein